MPLDDFARHPLLFGPSPVHPLDRLSDHLAGARIWAKREDCNSGLAYGGNKTRKLEYLVPDALRQGADTLVSIGGVQSNHTRQVAAVAAKLGLKAVLVQESWVDWPDAVNDKVGNILLSRIMGADVQLVDAGFGIGFKDSWTHALDQVRAAGGTPYPIPAGASDHPLGGLGFANWAYEVERQERELGVFFDTIVVCSVTGSTQAGMIAGFAGQDRPRRVLGIDGSAKPAETHAQVAKIARNTAELIGLGRELRDEEITLLEGWAGDLYGVPVASTLDAIRLTGGLEGVILDPVYEGKSMAGLIDLVRGGDIPEDSKGRGSGTRAPGLDGPGTLTDRCSRAGVPRATSPGPSSAGIWSSGSGPRCCGAWPRRRAGPGWGPAPRCATAGRRAARATCPRWRCGSPSGTPRSGRAPCSPSGRPSPRPGARSRRASSHCP